MRGILPGNFDALGQSLWDAQVHGSSLHAIERDDGRLEAFDARIYFRAPAQWSSHERQALRFATGRVLDIGCGAGRHALYLQARGLHVLGIDESPLAIKTTRARGLRRARPLSICQVSPRLGAFDTILMLGNNFGLFGSAGRARRLLRCFGRLTSPGGRIIAESNDIYRTTDPAHLAYHQRNRRRGRMAGQIRLRVRYGQLATPWFDYLMVSPAEMRQIVEGAGWRIDRIVPSAGSSYIAVLCKEGLSEQDAGHAAGPRAMRPKSI